jgi:hypothetical protein
METAVVQRWSGGRQSFRPVGEVINPSAYEVAELSGDALPKAFVLNHHYSGTYPAARWRFGLYRSAQLVGVAVFSHPCNDAVLTSVFPGQATDSTELGRFVLLDDVPANGETWFLSRAFDLLKRKGVRGVVSFADPVPRQSADGTVTTPGHVGTIYQAFNGVYLGRGTARTLRVLPSGATFSDRAAQKIRRGERGWRYAAEQLVAAGAASPDLALDLGEWLKTAIASLRRVKHPGNHRYAWAFERSDRKSLAPRAQRYPKLAQVALAA